MSTETSESANPFIDVPVTKNHTAQPSRNEMLEAAFHFLRLRLSETTPARYTTKTSTEAQASGVIVSGPILTKSAGSNIGAMFERVKTDIAARNGVAVIEGNPYFLADSDPPRSCVSLTVVAFRDQRTQCALVTIEGPAAMNVRGITRGVSVRNTTERNHLGENGSPHASRRSQPPP